LPADEILALFGIFLIFITISGFVFTLIRIRKRRRINKIKVKLVEGEAKLDDLNKKLDDLRGST